jgi:putative copper resistance protein D
MEACAFTLARCCVLLPALALFGSACFSIYAASDLRGSRSLLFRIGPPALAVTGALVWIVLLGRQMEGAPGLPSAAALSQICLMTGFGRALCAAALLSLALAGLNLRRDGWGAARIGLSAALLMCLAFVGHAAAAPGVSGDVRVAVMAVHLLAAGLWLGGLPSLARAMRQEGPAAARLLRRFGAVALAAVCAILATGVGSSLFVLGMTGGRLGPGYLAVLSAKLALVAALLGLAAVNRFRLTPQLERGGEPAVAALRRTVLLEQLCGVGVIAAVALLGQLDPSM